MTEPREPAPAASRAELAGHVAHFTHEAASQLTAMLSHVELLLRTGDLSPPARADAEALLGATRELLQMVYDLGAAAGGTRRTR